MPRWFGRLAAPSLALIFAVLSLGQWPGGAEAFARLDRLAVKLGLGVTQIAVTGLDRAMPEDVFAAIETAPDRSILTFDSEAAELRLEALPWIKSASISRALPGEVTVRLTERKPFAIWQNRQMPFLIDDEGRTLEPVAPSEYPALPIVAGAGAAEEASAIMLLVARHPAIRRRLGAAIRVAGRRWTLKLRNGPDLLLSASDPEGSLARLDALDKEHALLDRQLVSVDLRQPATLVLHPARVSG
jgi:cell division protein FtsQ